MTVLPRLCFALAVAGSAQGQPSPLHGPRGVRDEFLLAETRLTMPAVLPDALADGRWLVRARLDWGNDFARDHQPAGEAPSERRYLVDGEHVTLDLELERGLGGGLDVGLRVPLRWRGGGILDRLIDGFHVFTKKLGLPDNDRPLFRRDVFSVEGRDPAGESLSLEGQGAGLGNVEALGRWTFTGGAGPLRAGFVLRAMLPTGTGPFDAEGVGVGAQVVGARRQGRWDFGAGLGATHETDREVQGFLYARTRGHAFASAEWRVARRFALVAETTAASRLVTNVDRLPPLAWYLGLGGRLDLDSGLSIEGGFVENIADQQATTDIAFQLALVRR
ncbi:MAG TPA: DUF3187 family protein [Vicinamibacteria bacterium]|nr:DUF3187 family protein [Vicinamibacteria bacterium]